MTKINEMEKAAQAVYENAVMETMLCNDELLNAFNKYMAAKTYITLKAGKATLQDVAEKNIAEKEYAVMLNLYRSEINANISRYIETKKAV